MDSLFHFVFPLIAALAARVHMKHGVPAVVLMSLSSLLIDIDHFIPGGARMVFHNVFFTLAIPSLIVFMAYKWGTETARQASICLLLFLSSHMILDLFSEGKVGLLYPLSDQLFGISANFAYAGYTVISSSGIGLLLYFSILLLCFYLEELDMRIMKY